MPLTGTVSRIQSASACLRVLAKDLWRYYGFPETLNRILIDLDSVCARPFEDKSYLSRWLCLDTEMHETLVASRQF